MTTATETPAAASGAYAIGGDLEVFRLGFGAMRITGPGIWGDPADPDECVRVLRRAIELGVNFIDTADAYGPFVSELLIKKALRPYPEGLVIATKAGLTRAGPGDWRPVGRPEYLRQQVELSLRHLGVERLDLIQLHRIDAKVPLAEQVGELNLLREEGKVHHIGLSEVTVENLVEAQETAPIVSVQNLYNIGNRSAEALLDYSEAHDIGFIPWFPLQTGDLAREGSPLSEISARLGATPSQLALAWLLRRSPVMLPIPGTASVAHLEENMVGGTITLGDADFEALSAAAA
jgi:pyridoxine 4-dehydrogenase